MPQTFRDASSEFTLILEFVVGMKQLIGKLNDLWPEHSVALSIPKEIDKTKEKIQGVEEVEGKKYEMKYTYIQYIYYEDKNKNYSYTEKKLRRGILINVVI